MDSGGMLFDFRECFLMDSRDNHFDAQASCGLKHEKRKFSVSGNETVSI